MLPSAPDEDVVSFFESLLVLLAAAIVLLQVSRRLHIPYPAMLAGAGVLLALIPGAPHIALDPHTSLALFIAPALVDAAFDFPAGTVRKLWSPLLSLAVVAVVLSAGAVACLGVAMAGLPFYAALALGAIVAPPDAAAATAILGSIRMPRKSVALLKGESLLNDASALLLFSAATSFQEHGGSGAGLVLRLGLAAPAGVLLGFVLAKVLRHVVRFTSGTLGGNLSEFVISFGVWILAEKLGVSAVLCLVAFAMTIAPSANLTTPPRMRIHSFAVWGTAVFLLNVLAFLLMGLQARTIVGDMAPERLRAAAWFALAVVTCVIVVRMIWVLIYNRLSARFPVLRSGPKATLKHGVLVGWCGMRGLVTLATAFALPPTFPQRDLVVLTAFAVVLATLVLQGLTVAPLVRWLGLDGEDGLGAELGEARSELATAALANLDGASCVVGDPSVVQHWRYRFELAATAGDTDARAETRRTVGLTAMRSQRERLDQMKREQRVGPDAFLILQEELDFEEVALSSTEERQIEES